MINLVVALPAEARPLIEYFALQRQSTSAYPLYKNGEFALIVSGVGKTAVAAATAFLHANRDSEKNSAWLNIGIAGHREHALGNGYLIHKITDPVSGRKFYPSQVIAGSANRESLISVDNPVAEYPQSGLVDMEASGFYATASRFSTSELVQCFKVISDNSNMPANQITARGISQLLQDQMENIQNIAAALDQLSTQLRAIEQAPIALEIFRQRWHFTVSETHQLQHLLRRWQATTPDLSPLTKELAALHIAKDVLKLLTTKLDNRSVQFESA